MTWAGSILLFVNIQEISFSSKLQHTKVSFKGKGTNHGVEYGLDIPAEYIYYGNEKAIQWQREHWMVSMGM